MFDSPLLAPLELRHARYIAPWDALHDREPARASSTRGWPGSSATGMRPLIGFGHSLRSRRWARHAARPGAVRPRVPRLPRALSRRPRLDRVERGQPPRLAHRRQRPRRAAAFFDAMARECPTLQHRRRRRARHAAGWPPGSLAFRRHARHRPRIWGLHNYVDANRHTAPGHADAAALHGPRPGLVHRDRRDRAAARVQGQEGRDARSATGGSTQVRATRHAHAARLPEPARPARLPLPLAGAVPRHELGLGLRRPARRAAAGLRHAAAPRPAPRAVRALPLRLRPRRRTRRVRRRRAPRPGRAHASRLMTSTSIGPS